MTTTVTSVGQYEILGRLGRGGMAEVFLARDRGPHGFHHPVVIKRVRSDLAADGRFVRMFLDEARVVAALHHPNIVGIHDLRNDDGLYMVMEYLEGESVASVHRRLMRRRGVPLSAGLTAYVAANVCAALSAAHELNGEDGKPLGIVHRDVSPENIIITYDGHIKLLDFGIAWMQERRSATEAGQVKGKYAYMSPEQAEGLPLDARADVFSLGIVMHELSTGQRLFKRNSEIQTLRAVCEETIPFPGDVYDGHDPELGVLIMRALARDPALRFQTAREFRMDATQLANSKLVRELPEVPLAAMMQSLFSDRIAQRRDILTKVRQGRPVSRVNIPITSSIEIPSDLVSPNSTLAVEPRPMWRRRVTSLALVAVALLSLGVMLALVDPVLQQGPTPAQAAAHLPVAPLRLPAAKKVAIEVITTPPGASVRIGDEDFGTTPLELRLDQGEDAVEVVVELSGYEPIRTAMSTAQNVAHRFELRPIRKVTRKVVRKKPQRTKRVAAKSTGYKKFR